TDESKFDRSVPWPFAGRKVADRRLWAPRPDPRRKSLDGPPVFGHWAGRYDGFCFSSKAMPERRGPSSRPERMMTRFEASAKHSGTLQEAALADWTPGGIVVSADPYPFAFET